MNPAPCARRAIRFVYQGRLQVVDGVAPTLSVLEWLRTQARRAGTKEGCAEGDCGACTAIVAEYVGDTPPSASGSPEPETAETGGQAIRLGPLKLRTVNTCIRFLPTLDGKALITVEDLARHGSLHPAQQALVDHHGSQCGFCTPGFAVSLAACYEQHQQAGTRPQRQELADALAGNLCRCTGYRPILEAGQAMFDLPVQRLDVAALAEQLKPLQADAGLHYEGPHADGSGSIQAFHAPRSVEELAALRLSKPEAQLLAGGTDVGLWVNKQFRPLGDIISVNEVPALREVRSTADGGLLLGAGLPLEDAWAALVSRWPALRELWLRFAGPPVRHAGTLGGNLANGSPIGDGAPALIALNARLLLRRGTALREVALDDFYTDYMKNRLEPGEWLQAIAIPPQHPRLQLRAWKLSKRYDSDISALCGAFAIQLEGDVIEDVRIAFGGMAGTVKRAIGTEAALRGQPWTEATLREAQDALDRDFTPLTDLRASASYRRDAARGLLRRLWLQTRLDRPMPAQTTTVWLAHAEPSVSTP